MIKQAREFFDGWLDLFPAWSDFVQTVGSDSLAEFGGTGENTIKQITEWLGGAAEAGVLDAELSVMDLSDYGMLCCMIDENNTQQQITPKIVFENVIAALFACPHEFFESLNQLSRVPKGRAHREFLASLKELINQDQSVLLTALNNLTYPLSRLLTNQWCQGNRAILVHDLVYQSLINVPQ